MLSESERQKLKEIEALLLQDDPTFAGRITQRRRPGPGPRGVVATLAVLVAVCIAVTAQLTGSVAVAVIAWIAAGACVASWLTHRPRRTPGTGVDDSGASRPPAD